MNDADDLIKTLSLSLHRHLDSRINKQVMHEVQAWRSHFNQIVEQLNILTQQTNHKYSDMEFNIRQLDQRLDAIDKKINPIKKIKKRSKK